MDDELEMDASGCWVKKNARLHSDIPLRSRSEHYNRLARSFDAKNTVEYDKKDEVLFNW